MPSGESGPQSPGKQPHSRTEWQQILEIVRQKVNLQSYRTWLRPTSQAGSLNGNRQLVVAVPNDEFAQWIKEHFHDLILSAAEQLGFGQLTIEYRAPERPPVVPKDLPRSRNRAQIDPSF